MPRARIRPRNSRTFSDKKDIRNDKKDLAKDRADRNVDQRDINHDKRDLSKDRAIAMPIRKTSIMTAAIEQGPH